MEFNSFNGWVIILLKIYKHAFLLIKYPCSTRDLGPPRPSFCLHSLWSMEAYWAHILAWAFKTSLRRRLVPSWVVLLCMGFIDFPCNPRDTALSLFLSFFSSTPVPMSWSIKDHNKWPLNRDMVFTAFRTEWLGPTEVVKYGVMGQMAGKPHHFSLQMVENYLDCNNCSHLILAVCFLYL